MSRYWLPKLSFFFALILFLFASSCFAYIDPGTSSSFYPLLAPLLSLLAVFLGILFRPLIKFLRFLFDRLRRK